VRQPLSKIIIPVQDSHLKQQIEKVADLIRSEVNVKEIEFIAQTEGFLVKTIKPNFKLLGPRFGKIMKDVAGAISAFSNEQIATIESVGQITINAGGQTIDIGLGEVEIITEDIPGWVVNVENGMTVALDITITDALGEEGIAREFINRIQNIRKESGFEVTDRIHVSFEPRQEILKAIENNYDYICSEILADKINSDSHINKTNSKTIEVLENVEIQVIVNKAE
jgi:isoleucyl-tRNA synthetase